MAAETPELELIYFDARGRAESIRLAFTVGGVPFVDSRLSGEQFGQMKSSFPCGCVPVLKVGDQMITESHALLRYAGKLGGLYPKDSLEALFVDEALDLDRSMAEMYYDTMRLPEEEKLAARKKVTEQIAVKFLPVLQKRLTANAGPFLLGEQISIADLQLFNTLSIVADGVLDGITMDAYKSAPAMNELYLAVKSYPKISEYYAARKKT